MIFVCWLPMIFFIITNPSQAVQQQLCKSLEIQSLAGHASLNLSLWMYVYFLFSLINCSEPTWTMLSLSSHYIGMKKICRHWPLTEYGTEKYCLTKCCRQINRAQSPPTSFQGKTMFYLHPTNYDQFLLTFFNANRHVLPKCVDIEWFLISYPSKLDR